MRLKIVSDGTAQGTKVVDAETGAELENVVAVMWEARADQADSTAQISLMRVQAEMIGTAS